MAGGVDLILVETVFDTLTGKAALFAVARYFTDRGGEGAGDDFRDCDGSKRAHLVGANHRGILAVGGACAAPKRGDQLRPWVRGTCALMWRRCRISRRCL